jgi:nitrogen fixation protein NifU and related proteins
MQRKIRIKGICGDEMEFYLIIEDDIIKSIKFQTTGCYFTILCDNAVACEAEGKNIIEALKVNPGQILSDLEKLPEHHYHCTIFATSTLYKAIAGYLFEKNSELGY